jgi:hypothetical protein
MMFGEKLIQRLPLCDALFFQEPLCNLLLFYPLSLLQKCPENVSIFTTSVALETSSLVDGEGSVSKKLEGSKRTI